MISPKGRATSPFRTPLLLREYLIGEREFPGDSREEREARLRGGDYIARIHQRIKAYIKVLERETGRSYQYPRRHSFQTMIQHLITLGLLEKTGRQEEPQERGAARVGVARGFQRRTWVRLTMGSATRPEWADPMGYIALRYPGIRPAGKQPTAAPPEAPTPAPRRRRPARRPAAGPSVEVVAQLEQERQRVATLVLAVATRGTTVAHFQRAYDDITGFIQLLAQHYPRNPFPRVAEDLPLLRNCITLLQQEPMTRPMRATRVANCQASTAVLARALGSPLEPPAQETPVPQPPRPRAPRRPQAPAEAPRRRSTENGAPQRRRRRAEPPEPTA